MRPTSPPQDHALQESYLDGVVSGLAALPEAGLLVDPQGVIRYWNRRAEWQLGWTAEQAVGESLGALLLSDRDVEAIFQQLETTGDEHHGPYDVPMDVSVRRRQGQPFSGSLSVTRLQFPDGAWHLLVVRDQTARKRMERYISRLTLETRLLHQATTLASESESFEEALQHCVNIICEVTRWPLGCVYFVEPEQESLTLAPVSLVDLPLDDLRELRGSNSLKRSEGLPGRVLASVEPQWLNNIEQDESLSRDAIYKLGLRGSFAFPVQVNDEAVAVLEFFATEPVEPDPQLLLMVRNLSSQLGRVIERKRAQQQDGRLASIVDSSADAIIARDLSGKIASWNEGAVRMYGYTEQEAIGRTIELIIPGQTREESVLRDAIAAGERIEQVEVIRARKNGTRMVVSVTLSPMRDDKKRLIGWSTIERDISDRIRANRELRRAKEEAEAAYAAKNEFLASISHELRTPMNAIVGMTDLLLRESLRASTRKNLRVIKGAAHQLLYLINDLLDFSRMEAGRFELDLDDFSLRPALDELMKQLALQASERGLELTCRVEDDVPDRLRGDVQRLRQVLTNLVGNAIKFTEQGEIAVRVKLDEEAIADSSAPRLRFQVRDTGVGISEAHKERIFASFTQGQAPRQRLKSGTGLGLAICRQLTGLMGGRIWVESELDIGSTFSFTATFGRPADGAGNTLGAAGEHRVTGRRILVVDDNSTNRAFLVEALDELGAISTAVATAEEGLAELSRASGGDGYWAVLVDALMPDVDGPTFIQRLIDSHDETTKVVLMASAGDRSLLASRLPPKLRVLQKPVAISDLVPALVHARPARATTLGGQQDVPPSADRQPARKSLTVLVAEDTVANQQVVETMLTRFGHEVTIAQNGREAVEWVQRKTFDLVLMDISMPIMDGFQATSAIRGLSDPEQSSIPVLAMTAYARPEDRDRCLANEMNGYISKPFDIDELEALLQQVACDCSAGFLVSGAAPMSSAMPDSVEQADASESGEAAVTLFDHEAAVRRFGDASLFSDMVGFLREGYGESVETMRRALEDQDGPLGERTAHSLKSLVASLDAKSAQSAAQGVEDAFEAGAFADAADRLEELRVSVDQLLRALSDAGY